jgi:hypothetical protein
MLLQRLAVWHEQCDDLGRDSEKRRHVECDFVAVDEPIGSDSPAGDGARAGDGERSSDNRVLLR